MTCLFPLISNLTVLDLQLPGTHDTLTFHLSDRIADNANDISPALSALLHDLIRPPIAFVGAFIKSMAVTQRLNLPQQLDAGIRFLDLRCTFSRPPTAAAAQQQQQQQQQQRTAEQWVGLHFVETILAFTEYLTDIRSWLDAHPRELVVLSVTRHGDFCLNGPGQFPGCDQSEKDALWEAMTSTFHGLLVNHSQGLLNETTLQQLLDRGQRVVAFAGDYSSLTRSSALALDACVINNVCLQDMTDVQQSATSIMSFMSDLRALRAASKRNNTFVLLSLADAVPDDMVKLNALILYDPLQREQHRLACAALFKFPNASAKWCPRNLTDISLTAAYYNQLYLDAALSRGYALPNAIYTDAIGDTGTLLTSAVGWAQGDGNKYAYAATLLLSTVQQLCGSGGSDACVAAVDWLTQLRKSFPLTLVDEPDTGRYATWPLI